MRLLQGKVFLFPVGIVDIGQIVFEIEFWKLPVLSELGINLFKTFKAWRIRLHRFTGSPYPLSGSLYIWWFTDLFSVVTKYILV